MRAFALFGRAPQARIAPASNTNDLAPGGSYVGFAAAGIAACALIFSAGAQNVAHAYALGLASSEFRALVLAAASAGASVLGPCAWLAVFRGRGFGTRVIALVLALGCLAYAGVCSLGFVAGSKDRDISERVADADAYADARAIATAARAELATLATIRTPSRAVIERRRELASILAPHSPDKRAKPVGKDSQASALGFYLRAAGWHVTDDAVSVWLSLGMVLFLECAAALSLTVAAALRPTPATRRGELHTATQPSGQISSVAAVSPDVSKSTVAIRNDRQRRASQAERRKSG
jgi:hypothetical protein